MRPTRRHARLLAAAAVVGLVAGVPPLSTPGALAAPTDVTTRVSVAGGGGQANGRSEAPAMSADGRYVAFSSVADNLGGGPDQPAPGGDGPDQPDSDVFVHDRGTGTTNRVSLAADGTERRGESLAAAISGDGGQLAFVSDAAFTPGDTDDRFRDVYARARAGGPPTLVSDPDTVVAAGSDRPSLSRDGRLVAYTANTAPAVPAVLALPESLTLDGDFAGAVQLVGVGVTPATVSRLAVERSPGVPSTDFAVDPGDCAPPAQLAAGASCDLTVTATTAGPAEADLVITDDGVGSPHRVHLTRPGEITTSSTARPRCCQPALQPHRLGTRAAVSAGVADLGTNGTGQRAERDIPFDSVGTAAARITAVEQTGSADISLTGCAVGTVLPPGTSCAVTATLTGAGRGPQAGTMSLRFTLASCSSECPESDTGPVVLFGQEAVDTVLVADRDTDRNGVLDEPGNTATTALTVPGDLIPVTAGEPSLSADGRYLAFATTTALVPADTSAGFDVYRILLDRNGDGTPGDLGLVNLVSAVPGGAAAGSGSEPSVSADGHAVAFTSGAADLVRGDGNGRPDVFVRDLTAGSTVRASVTGTGIEANGTSTAPALSADGRSVAFVTNAVNLGGSGRDGDGNESDDTEVLLRDLVARTTERVSTASGDGTAPGTNAAGPAVSADGRYVAFDAPAPLVAGDSNEVGDVFVRDRRPVARLAPDPVDFGDQQPGRTSGALPLAISNAGTGPLVVGTLTAAGPDAADVSVINPCAGIVLFAGQSCPAPASIRVTLSHPGALDATVVLASSGDPATARVRANGAAVGLVPTPTPLDLGSVPVGMLSPVVPLALANTGTVPLRLTAVRLTGPAATDLTLVPAAASACPGPDGTLAPDTSCRLAVTFRPGAVGIRTAALLVDAVGVLVGVPPPTGDPTGEPAGEPTGAPAAAPTEGPPASPQPPDQPFTLTVPVTGIGLPGGLTVAPNPLQFGAQPVGRLGAPKTVVVTVVGPGPVRVGVPALSGPDANQYTVDASGCANRTLPPGGSCRLVIRLKPNRVGGPIQVTLQVPSVDIPAAQSVLLAGAGAAPTLQLDPSVGPPGTVVHVTGGGYPPGAAIQLSWDPGLGGEPATASGTGTLDEQFLVLPRDQLGNRDAVATGPGGVQVTAPFLVVPPDAAPPRFINSD